MGNTRNGREARTDRKESAKDRAEEWEKLTTVQKLQQLPTNRHTIPKPICTVYSSKTSNFVVATAYINP